MVTVYVYNPQRRAVERFYRELHSPMPYSEGHTLTAEAFLGSSRSNVIWTDKRALEAWSAFCRDWGRPLSISSGFKRIWEGGHGLQSQHYAGMAFDIAKAHEKEQQSALREHAIQSGIWSHVEPVSVSPAWVHVDKRVTAGNAAGYPAQHHGAKGVYVFVLQDALSALGFRGSGLDGVFGEGTRTALRRFQHDNGLEESGIAEGETWKALFEKARGLFANAVCFTDVKYIDALP